jgi:hypothetical protein
LNVRSESSFCEKVFVVPDKAYGGMAVNGLMVFTCLSYTFVIFWHNVLYTDVLLYDTKIKWGFLNDCVLFNVILPSYHWSLLSFTFSHRNLFSPMRAALPRLLLTCWLEIQWEESSFVA